MAPTFVILKELNLRFSLTTATYCSAFFELTIPQTHMVDLRSYACEIFDSLWVKIYHVCLNTRYPTNINHKKLELAAGMQCIYNIIKYLKRKQRLKLIPIYRSVYICLRLILKSFVLLINLQSKYAHVKLNNHVSALILIVWKFSCSKQGIFKYG